MTLDDLQEPGPPVTPADVAEALGVTPRYIRRLIEHDVLEAVMLPSAGRKRERGRWRIPREAARRLAVELGHEADGGNVGNRGNRGNARREVLDTVPRRLVTSDHA
jgi:hypothetical protein